jgi:hypothetical protein
LHASTELSYDAMGGTGGVIVGQPQPNPRPCAGRVTEDPTARDLSTILVSSTTPPTAVGVYCVQCNYEKNVGNVVGVSICGALEQDLSSAEAGAGRCPKKSEPTN